MYKIEKNKKAISLIMLVIIIVILLILSGAIILTYKNQDLDEATNLATVQSDMQYMLDSYEVKYNEILVKYSGNESLITQEDIASMQSVIPEKYQQDYKATVNGIKYVGDNEEEREIAKKMGIYVNTSTPEIASVDISTTTHTADININLNEEEVTESVQEYKYYTKLKNTNNWTLKKRTNENVTVISKLLYGAYDLKVDIVTDEGTIEYIDPNGFSLIPIQVGSLKLTQENKNGQEYIPDTWSNKSIYFSLTQGNADTTYSINEDVKNTKEDYLLEAEGSYTAVVDTTDGTNSDSKHYNVNIDKTPANLDTVTVVTPNSNSYKVGQEIILKATFNENVYSIQGNTDRAVIDANTYPKMKIKFGEGQEKDAQFVEATKNTITYKYTIQAGDNGILNMADSDSKVYDIANNETLLTAQNITGSEVEADTTAPKAPTIITKLNNANGEDYTPDTWTNQDVYLEFKSNDDYGQIVEYQWFVDGKWTTEWLTKSDTVGIVTLKTQRDEEIKVRSIDKAGNISEEASIKVKIDKTAPKAPTITTKLNDKNGEPYTEGTWTNQNIYTEFVSTDDFGEIAEYQWFVHGNWSTEYLTSSKDIGIGTFKEDRDEDVQFRVVDKAGNISEVSKYNVKMDKTKPTYTSAEIKNVTQTGYDVYVYGVKDTLSKIDRVQFPTWTENNEKDDIQSNWETNTNAKGVLQSDGTTWVYRVNRTDHKNEFGKYITNTYIYDKAGNYVEYKFDDSKVDVPGVLTFSQTPVATTTKSKLIYNGQPYGELPEVIKEGETFGGWCTDEALRNQVTSDTIVAAVHDHTLYQRWASIRLTPNELTLDMSGTKTYQLTVEGDYGTATYSTSNANVATVDGNGKVTAVGNGTATITATGSKNNVQDTCKITVKTSVTNISLNKTSLNFTTKTSETLIATVTPATASDSSVKWSSSNPHVATVDNNGKVTAIGNGTATITVAANDGSGKKATCTVTVNTGNELKVNLEVSKTDISLNETVTLKATTTGNEGETLYKFVVHNLSNDEWYVIQDYATTSEVSWAPTSNAVREIVVRVKDANHTTDETGVLSNYVKVYTLDSISLDKTNATLDLSGTKTLKLNAKYGNATIDASELDWMTSNGSTASVDSTGLVTALKNGTTTITVMKKNSSLSATCSIIVQTSPTAITLDKTSADLNATNNTITLSVSSYTPVSSNVNREITWSSSDTAVATIDSSGKVTAVGTGTAIITATTANGVKATCQINCDITAPKAPTITAKYTDVNGSAYTPGTWTNQDIYVEFVSTDDDIVEYQCFLEGKWTTEWLTSSTGKGIVTFKLERDEDVRFRAIDKAGNISPESTIRLSIDKTAPTYTSAEVKNITETGYDVYVYGVSDTASKINRVQFPTWTVNNDKDDIQSNWETNTSVKGTLQTDGTTWVYRVNKTAHNNEFGNYATNIHIYDKAGNVSSYDFKETYINVPGTLTYNQTPVATSPTSKLIYNGQTYGELPTLTRTGYTFAGWYSDEALTTQVTKDTKVTAVKDHSLYQKWNAETYTVKYDANGGTGEMSVDTVTYGAIYVTKNNAFSKVGYKFKGWNEKADGTGTNWTSYIGKNWKWDYTKDVTLYAQWEPDIYEVKYDANGGTGTMATDTATYGVDYTTKSNEFNEPEGYTFAGWNEKADGTGVDWTGYIGKAWNWKYTNSVTLYAQWANIEVTPTSCTLDLSGTKTQQLTVTGNYGKATYATSNASVATVSSTGLITAVGNGTATITVTGKKGIATVSATCVVTVKTSVSSITLDKTSLNFTTKTSETLIATVAPSTASNKEIEWSTSDANVATVDSNGKVTAVANGTATITVAAKDGSGKKATCIVTVNTGNELKVNLEVSKKDIALNETVNLTASATGNEGETLYKFVAHNLSTGKWETIQDYATTSEVTWAPTTYAVREIVVRVKDANHTTDDTGVLSNYVKVYTLDSITLDKTSATLDINGTKTLKLTAKHGNATIDESQLDWMTSSGTTASVDSTGLVTALKNGTTTITVMKKNSSVSATCSIIVQTSPIGITLDKTSVTLDLSGNKTLTLIATLDPLSSNVNRDITWSSSNTAVATVDNSGKVTAVSSGTTTITAKTTNEKTATCNINVVSTAVTFDQNYLTGDLFTYTDTSRYKYWATELTKAELLEPTSQAGQIIRLTMGAGTQGGPYYNPTKDFTAGQKYTWSMNIRASSAKILNIGVIADERVTANLTSEWQHITGSFTYTSGSSKNFVFVVNGSTWTAGDYIEIQNFEIRKGDYVGLTSQNIAAGNALVTLPTVTEREGYEFKGWYTSPCGGTPISTSTIVPQGGATYYAQWKPKTYEVKYDANSGTGTMATDTAIYNQGYTTKENGFTKKGYKFKGWNEKADGTGADWTNYIGKVWNWKYTNSITLYAQWEAETYTVTYDANGGTGTMATDPVTYGVDYTTKANGFTEPEGYTFAGWNEKADGTGTSWAGYIGKPWNWTYQKSITLYAQWANIVVTPASCTLDLSGTKTQQLTVTGNYGTATYSTSNANVATVSSTGLITAVGNGTATITVTGKTGIATVTGTCAVTVKTSVSSITLNKTSLNFTTKTSETLTATVAPSTASNKALTWTTSDASVATVDSNGKVTAVGNGTATITVAAKDGSGKKATCTVTVNTGNELKVNLSVSKTDIAVNETVTLKATTTGNEGETLYKFLVHNLSTDTWGTIQDYSTASEITWKPTNNAVRELVVKVTDAKHTPDANGVLSNYVKVYTLDSITLDKTSATLDLSGTKTTTLTAKHGSGTINATDITWSSSNASVATVDSSGKVTAVGNGTATITATKKNTSLKATCTVTVQTSPTGITLDKTSATLNVASKTITLTATIAPSTANANKTITWSSSNTAVATVDSSGKVTAVGNGTATITAKTGNGKTATCTVTADVTAPAAPTITAKYTDANGSAYTSGTWTNQNIYVEFVSTDTDVAEYQWYLNGSWTTQYLTEYTTKGIGTFSSQRNGNVKFRAIDKAGNISSESTIKICIDKTAPTVPTVIAKYTDANGDTYTPGTHTNKDVYIEFVSTDSYGEIKEYQWYTGGKWTTQYLTSYTDKGTVTLKSERSGDVKLRVIDKAGNTAETSIAVNIDKTAPAAPTITAKYTDANGSAYTSGTWTNKDVYVEFVSTATDVAEYQWYTGGKWTTQYLTSYTDKGTVTLKTERNADIRLRAVDKAGNASEESTIKICIDKTAPTVPTVTAKYTDANGSTYTPGTLTNKNIYVEFVSTDSYGEIKEYQWYAGGVWTTEWLTSYTTKGICTFKSDRNEDVKLRVVDKAGNTAETSIAINIDKTAPTVGDIALSRIITFTNGSSVTSNVKVSNATVSGEASTYAIIPSGCTVSYTLKSQEVTGSGAIASIYKDTSHIAQSNTGNYINNYYTETGSFTTSGDTFISMFNYIPRGSSSTSNTTNTCVSTINSVKSGSTQYLLIDKDTSKLVTTYMRNNVNTSALEFDDKIYFTRSSSTGGINAISFIHNYDSVGEEELWQDNTIIYGKWTSQQSTSVASSNSTTKNYAIGTSYLAKFTVDTLDAIKDSSGKNYKISPKPYGYKVVFPYVTVGTFSKISYSVSGSYTQSETGLDTNGASIYLPTGCTLTFYVYDHAGNVGTKTIDLT